MGYTVEGGASTVESSAYSQKFLNSGCVVGEYVLLMCSVYVFVETAADCIKIHISCWYRFPLYLTLYITHCTITQRGTKHILNTHYSTPPHTTPHYTHYTPLRTLTTHYHALHHILNHTLPTGRAGQLRHMLSYAKQYSRTYRDDQLVMVRYHHEYPSVVGIDTGMQCIESLEYVQCNCSVNNMCTVYVCVEYV